MAMVRARKKERKSRSAADLVKSLPRLIFCLTTGRSGTRYLASLLDAMPGVKGVHEGKPAMVDVARAARNYPKEAWRYWYCEKLPKIATFDCDVYAETDHLFGKGFVQALLDLEVVPDVIVLNRNPRDVALSFWRRGSIPGQTLRGQRYLLHPERAEYCTLNNWWEWTHYQLCYWYVMEMNKRIADRVDWIASAGGRIVAIDFEQLITEKATDWLMERLDLPLPDKSLDNLPRNATPEQYSLVFPPGDLDEQEAEVKLESTRYKGLDPRQRIDIIVLSMQRNHKRLTARLVELSHDKRYRPTIGFMAANPTSNNRNQIAKEFLDNERLPHWLMMIDEDTVPNGDVLKWVDSDYDIISFVTPVWKSQPKGGAHHIEWNVQLDPTKQLFANRLPEGKRVIEVASAGTGVILIKREVLEHREMKPPFVDIFNEYGIRTFGHDLHFCVRAHKLGFKVASVLQNPASHYKSLDLLDVARMTGNLK